MNKIKLYLMSGAGNLFTVFDNRNLKFTDKFLSSISSQMCNIFKDITTEGFIALNFGTSTDFNISFFNPDGSSGMMCGNGGRCSVKFANYLKIIDKNDNISFNMAGKIYNASFLKNLIKLEFDKPNKIESKIEINFNELNFIGDYIDVGTDHFCCNLHYIKSRKKLEEITRIYGPKIRYYSYFIKGVNANLFFIKNNIIQLFTYERGVENITGACGTGAISTAIFAVKNGLINFPVKINPPSKETLLIDIDGTIDNINKIFLIGNAKIIKSLEFDLNLINN